MAGAAANASKEVAGGHFGELPETQTRPIDYSTIVDWPKRVPVSVTTLPTALPHRIGSIDVLRGFNIFWILGADTAIWSLNEMCTGAGVACSVVHVLSDQMGHVPWEGFRFYDFIFPLLIFVTGVSIVFSLSSFVERGNKSKAYPRLLRRTLILYALGVIYYGGFSHPWPDIRLFGVLQRIGLCYFFASVLFLNLRLRGLIVTFITLLAGYWALMTFVPVPGIGTGSYAEGANLSNWIDAHYLPGMKWNETWDPEGLLSTLPAIGTCLLGVFAGLLLKESHAEPAQKSLWLMAGGAGMVAAGFLWGIQFPVIKAIWTSSYVLVAGGFSLILLGALHQIIDVWGYSKWGTVFMWVGANAITLYFLNNVTSFQSFSLRLLGGDVGAFLELHLAPGATRFAAAVVGLALALALARFLYVSKIFLRV